MRDIILDNSYSLRKELKVSLRQFFTDWQREQLEQKGCKLYHITLATDQQTSIEHARSMLRRWDASVNHAIIGGSWSRHEDQHCRWLAVLEGRKSDLHWHLAFCLSPELTRRRQKFITTPSLTHSALTYRVQSTKEHTGCTKHDHGLVADAWRKVTNGKGTADTVLIHYTQGISEYLSKEQHDTALYDSFVTSREFKR